VDETNTPDGLTHSLSSQLRRCIHALETKQADAVIGMSFYFCGEHLANVEIAQSGGHEVWQAIISMVKSISEVMLNSVPNFWKISVAFLDGKYRKVGTDTDRRCVSDELTCSTECQQFISAKPITMSNHGP
jgi:exocyst complex component 2